MVDLLFSPIEIERVRPCTSAARGESVPGAGSETEPDLQRPREGLGSLLCETSETLLLLFSFFLEEDGETLASRHTQMSPSLLPDHTLPPGAANILLTESVCLSGK